MTDTPKLPQELSLEELLKSIEGQEIKKEDIKTSFNDPVLSFTQAFQIIPGPNSVSAILLYELYKLWSKDAVLTIFSFNRAIGKYIPPRLIHGRRYYMVNTKVLKIAEKIDIARGSKKKNPDKSKTYHRHYTKFLTENGLDTPGKVYLELDIFYYVYNNWCNSIYKKPVSYNVFCKLTRLFFSIKRLTQNGNYWVGLNPNIKNIVSQELIKNWRENKRKKNDEKEYKIKKAYEKNIIYKGTYKKR